MFSLYRSNTRQVQGWYESTLVRPKIKYLLDSVRMHFLKEPHLCVRAITLFLWNTFSFWPWLLFYIQKFSRHFINMLPIFENKSYYWILITIYINDFMSIHPHLLVFIYSLTKFYRVLGLKSVDFYHSYTYL